MSDHTRRHGASNVNRQATPPRHFTRNKVRHMQWGLDDARVQGTILRSSTVLSTDLETAAAMAGARQGQHHYALCYREALALEVGMRSTGRGSLLFHKHDCYTGEVGTISRQSPCQLCLQGSIDHALQQADESHAGSLAASLCCL